MSQWIRDVNDFGVGGCLHTHYVFKQENVNQLQVYKFVDNHQVLFVYSSN